MKRIRINNDFTFVWAIERNGLPEDLSTAINMVLRARNSTGAIQTITAYEVAGNMVSVEITPEIANVLGRYNFILTYELPDASLDDMERLCEIDTDAFIIVPRTAEADDSTDLLVTSDMAIGFKGDKGDPFLYEDFTPEQLESLKVKGDKGDPFLYSDFTPEQLESLKVKGDKGNGIQSITLTSTVGLVKTYTITFTDLTTTTFTVTDGADGHSPVITFVGTTIYVDGVGGPDLKGEPGAPGQDGAPGSDAEVTNENVIAAIGFTPENVSNKKTTLTDSDTDYPTTRAVNTGLSEKQTKSLTFTDTEVLTTDFVADTTYADYGYKAEIAASGVTSADMAEVIFAPTESDSGNFASVAATGTDTVTIYAKAIPSETITIPTILITKL